jgi:ADP-L-glycero-D-manno-heptose 6-epimerase
MPETLRPKYQYFTCADVSKLRAAGFTQPFTPLADAVSDYVKNYLAPGRHLGD